MEYYFHVTISTPDCNLQMRERGIKLNFEILKIGLLIFCFRFCISDVLQFGAIIYFHYKNVNNTFIGVLFGYLF